MITYEIPGRERIEIKNIVFDYNGTLAVGGELIEGVRERFKGLSGLLNVYIVTADTYGTVEEKCGDLGVKILTFPRENAGESKRDIVRKLGPESTICIGNGFNDISMFTEAIISIAVIENEGCSGKLLAEADIVVKSILDAINIVINTDIMKATLRN